MFNWLDELKASFEKEVELGKTKFFLNAIGQPFEVPESARPLQLTQNFYPFNTEVVLDDGITIEENCWKVESYGKENKLLVFYSLIWTCPIRCSKTTPKFWLCQIQFIRKKSFCF